MANADFSPKQDQTPGGFDAGSYREAAPKTETARLTPAQQKLAGLEKSLPFRRHCAPRAQLLR